MDVEQFRGAAGTLRIQTGGGVTKLVARAAAEVDPMVMGAAATTNVNGGPVMAVLVAVNRIVHARRTTHEYLR